jgi:hypothetical protein
MKRKQTNDPPVAAAAPLDHHPPCHPLLAAKNVSTPKGSGPGVGSAAGPPRAPHMPRIGQLAARTPPCRARARLVALAVTLQSVHRTQITANRQDRQQRGANRRRGGGRRRPPAPTSVSPARVLSPRPPAAVLPCSPPRCGAGITPHRQGGGKGRSMPPSSAAAGPQKNNRPRGLGMGGLVAATCLFSASHTPFPAGPDAPSLACMVSRKGGEGVVVGGGGEGRKKGRKQSAGRVFFRFPRACGRGLIFFLTPAAVVSVPGFRAHTVSLLQPKLTAPQ